MGRVKGDRCVGKGDNSALLVEERERVFHGCSFMAMAERGRTEAAGSR